MSKLGLYVHIPFCRQKCLYCDFASYASSEHLFVPYTTALCQQITDQGGMLRNLTVDTVYIGGGTPSILPLSLMDQIVASLRASFTIEAEAEISMEANPGTVTKEKLVALKTIGINRLSFGVQSFDDQLLSNLGRIHCTKDSYLAVEHAYAAGFTNVSIDLMYGLPGQTVHGFVRELEQAVALGTNHLSVYGLKLEEGTPLAVAYERGLLGLPDEAEEEAMYDQMTAFLPAIGLVRYEISNFARPGSECRHNLKYWHYEPYVGLGCAAHSFLKGERKSYITGIEEYIKAIANGDSPIAMKEILTESESMAEFIFLALRTVQGMEFAEYKRLFKTDFFSQFGEVLSKLKRQKLVATDANRLWLTERGMKFGNLVFCSFLPD
ncbi:radical SAM family heme chaperone HemW [Sporomusa acidovorans]|uniref:Heme chaperone HemW n=1 Tax=Sporomusa acidovorans (strain ATCC 49682 / DSM 3132 / Mol) TaxID=1123286 RepID=A0ABZ3J4N9_SPOA4|nr:radical SAM family heme chaperone HemW [Sporomusa acidovorans]OZC23108.1 oxygen-independent coproporphyrinogen-III oxidase-like protein YqeR [Sporomusa acidovorans DSM 3132]SDF05728.1 oxygen-independent coproporphyrinogen-3 oxidase [Sporomusa acidovorans]